MKHSRTATPDQLMLRDMRTDLTLSLRNRDTVAAFVSDSSGGSMTHGGIKQATWEALLQGIALRKYNLLLGAGASRDVLDRNGANLPGGPALAKEIANEFGISARPSEQDDLARMYRAATGKVTAAGTPLGEWISQRFTRTQPPEWYRVINAAPWQKIWTLNIDDAVERSLGENVKPFNFSGTITAIPTGSTPLIHLHGRATAPQEGLIFSIQEYRAAVRNPRAWGLAFEEILSDQPFVIVGAALHHEFDLARALSERALSVDRATPTVAVLPNPSELDLADFASWNIEIFDGTADQFFEALKHELAQATTAVLGQLSINEPTPLALRFLEQWRQFRTGPSAPWRDFLSGEEPEYGDVERGDIITRDAEANLLKLVRDGIPVVLAGPPFSGKSSLAVHAARALNDEGWQVFNFEDDDKPSPHAVLARVRNHPKTVLICDQAGDFWQELVDLASEASSNGVALRLVVVDRDGRVDPLVNSGVFTKVSVPSFLSDTELSALLHLLIDRGRIQTSSVRGLTKALKSAGPSSFSTVITREVLKEGFEERVRRNFRSIGDPEVAAIVRVAAICSRVGQGISIGLAASAVGVTPALVERLIIQEATANSMVRVRNGRLRVRHRLFADLLTHRIVVDRELYDSALGVAYAVAPQLSIQAMEERTWVYRMARMLMDQEHLAELVGRGMISEFYQETESQFGWNSRFWEQRGLAASEARADRPAIRYATRAVAIHRNAYSLNTLATVRLKQWRRTLSTMPETKVHSEFWDCSELCDSARSAARVESQHPYITWFNAAIQYGRWMRGRGDDLTNALRKAWREWWNHASNSQAFAGPSGARTLRTLQTRWLELAPDPSADAGVTFD